MAFSGSTQDEQIDSGSHPVSIDITHNPVSSARYPTIHKCRPNSTALDSSHNSYHTIL